MDIAQFVSRTMGLLLVPSLLVVACGDDDEPYGPPPCRIGDPVEGLTCDCSGTECVCPSSGDCAISCVSECVLQCAGSGNCTFHCAADCQASCTGSGNCTMVVGNGSTVSCTGSGDCDITCEADCTVSCPGQGTCTVYCQPGASCGIADCPNAPESCPDDVLVCNGTCP
jgi:hypothetical protein